MSAWIAGAVVAAGEEDEEEEDRYKVDGEVNAKEDGFISSGDADVPAAFPSGVASAGPVVAVFAVTVVVTDISRRMSSTNTHATPCRTASTQRGLEAESTRRPRSSEWWSSGERLVSPSSTAKARMFVAGGGAVFGDEKEEEDDGDDDDDEADEEIGGAKESRNVTWAVSTCASNAFMSGDSGDRKYSLHGPGMRMIMLLRHVNASLSVPFNAVDADDDVHFKARDAQ